MITILRIILGLPAWIFLVLAGVGFYFGTKFIDDLDAQNRVLAIEAQLSPPEVVDFDSAKNVPKGEVAFRTRVFDDASYRFWYEAKGKEDHVEYYYFMEEPGATTTDRRFSAVLIFESSQAARVNEWWESVLEDPQNDYDLAIVRGYAQSSHYLERDAEEALYWLGGVKNENFVYIQPFLDGREAFYENAKVNTTQLRYGLWFLVGLVVALAIAQFLHGKPFKSTDGAVQDAKPKNVVANPAASLSEADSEVDEEVSEEIDSVGAVMSTGTVLSKVFGKQEDRNPPTQVHSPVPKPAAPAPVEPLNPAEDPVALRKARTPGTKEQAIYSPPRQLYDERGLPIDFAHELGVDVDEFDNEYDEFAETEAPEIRSMPPLVPPVGQS